ncbi:hypothetical protein FRC10_004584, partial [Ceratobasidium sp. 414]
PLNIAGLGVLYKDNPDIYSIYSKAQFEAAFTGAGRVMVYSSTKKRRRSWWDLRYGMNRAKGFLKSELPRYIKLTDEGLGEGTEKDLLHLQVQARSSG